MDLSLIAKSIQAVKDSVPAILTGTVTGHLAENRLSVVLDNDPARTSVSAVSLIGATTFGPTSNPVGARVLCLRYPPRGLVVLGFLDPPTPATATPTIVTKYTADNTWNKPTDPAFSGIWVRVTGAGGGSGGNDNALAALSPSAGGGGGATGEAWIPAASLAATVAVDVGAGGAAGLAGNNDGQPGAQSSFGGHVIAPGGGGGNGAGNGTTLAISGAGGAGGGTVTGTASPLLSYPGVDGKRGVRRSATDGTSGDGGGAGFIGNDQPSAMGVSTQTPFAGLIPGGGASGGLGINTATDAAGAAGARGEVVVIEYYAT